MQTMSLPSSYQINEVALFTARPMYWTVRPVHETAKAHTEGVIRLLQWCLRLPESRLGVDPKGLGLIIRSLFTLRNEKPDPDLDRLLDRVGASEDVTPWPGDSDRFGQDIERILGLLRSQDEKRFGDYVWLNNEDAQWWIEKTAESLREYSEMFRYVRDERQLLYFFIRHRCVVFAPLDSDALWGNLEALLQSAEPNRKEHAQAMLEYHGIKGSSDLKSDRSLFWSWRLIDFAAIGRDLVYQPTLTLWSAWPASRCWAPLDQQATKGQPFSTQEAASFLEDFMWRKVETLFSIVRILCGLGIAEPEFAGRETRPPVFYYVAPVDPVDRPELYLESWYSDLRALVRRCLGSDDPSSYEVAWGVLEGDLVALRRERVLEEAVVAWYLLLPVSRGPAERQEARAEKEKDIDFVVDGITYLEFSIGHEARDIATDLDEVSTRQALWGGTFDGVSQRVKEALELIPLIRPSERSRIQRDLAELLGLLHRLRVYMEKVHSDAAQVVRKYHGYKDGTEDFLRRSLTFSFPFSGLRSLLDALLDAYPYHYLQQPIVSLQNDINFLSSSITRLVGTLDAILAILGEGERLLRERQERATRRLGFVLGVLAILIGVPQFIPGVALTPESYPSWLSRFLPLRALESFMRVVTVIFIIPLLYLLTEAFFLQLYYQFRRPDPFRARVQRIWHLVEEAKGVIAAAEGAADVGARLEKMDEEACGLLSELWTSLHEYGREKQPSILRRLFNRLLASPETRAWLRATRRLRDLIALFDLAPPRIPLPRALCLFRYKSTDFYHLAAIPDWEFRSSLLLAGFDSGEISRLDSWLSSLETRQDIKKMEAKEFVARLKERGVSADPQKRAPEKWVGNLEA